MWKLPLAGGQSLVELMLSLVFLLCLALLLGQSLRTPTRSVAGVATWLRDSICGWNNPSILLLGDGSLLGLTPYRVVAVEHSHVADPKGHGSRSSAAPGFIVSARLACGDLLVPPFGEPRKET